MFIHQSFSVCELDIIYTCNDDSLIFIFASDTDCKCTIGYYSVHEGGHQKYISNYKNNKPHGRQQCWWSIQHGGHQWYIDNYKNGLRHGIQHCWWSSGGGDQRHIENYKNGKKHGIQYYWSTDGTYFTKHY
jgi:antitoxin component YwqK of YwqJK toxin-antitoxin module